MAAGGFKTFTTGEVLTSADTNNFLMQGVLVFDDATARDAAITAPVEGQVVYLKDTNQVLSYDGSTYVAVGGGSPLTTKGDLYTFSTSDTRLPVGADGTILVADSSVSPQGLKWAVDPVADVVTTAGDLIYGTAADTVARLGIGTVGQLLAVNTGATAPEWVAPTSPTFNFTAYTPSFTGLTVGNGTINFKFAQVGKVIFVNGSFILGSTSSVSSNIKFTLPVTCVTYAASAMLGSAHVRDEGTQNFAGNVVWSSTTQGILFVMNAAGTFAVNTAVTSTIPMSWANTDNFTVNFFYEAA